MRSPVRAVMVPLVLLGLAACNDSTAPTDAFDPVAANARAQDISGTLASNLAVQSLEVLGDAFGFPSATALVGATLPFEATAATSDRWLGTRLAALAAAAPSFSAAEPAVIIPADVLGTTLVYDAATRTYQIDESRTGAPENGARFTLYAVDPIRGQVLTPVQDHEIGYLDLRDESTPSADVLGITAVIGNEIVLDYQASASVGIVGGVTVTFAADGFVMGTGDQLDFTLRQQFSEASGVEIDYLVEAQNGGHTAELQVTAAPDESASIALTLRNGGDTIVLAISGTDQAVMGTITFNSDIVVQIQGTPSQPEFTDASGGPLDESARRALRELFQFVDDLFNDIDRLLRPAHRILSIPAFALR